MCDRIYSMIRCRCRYIIICQVHDDTDFPEILNSRRNVEHTEGHGEEYHNNLSNVEALHAGRERGKMGYNYNCVSRKKSSPIFYTIT